MCWKGTGEKRLWLNRFAIRELLWRGKLSSKGNVLNADFKVFGKL
jgi:hypothetical protein